MADAKSNVGVFSSFGVEEARDMFWRRFSDGKQFAKRQTMWDAMFMGENCDSLLRIFSNRKPCMKYSYLCQHLATDISLNYSIYDVLLPC